MNLLHYEELWWVGVMATRQFPELKILGSSPRPVAFYFYILTALNSSVSWQHGRNSKLRGTADVKFVFW